MNPKVTIGLVIVLVVLAGYVYFFEIRGTQPGQTDEEAATVYGQEYGEYDIVKLEIESPQGRALFARTDEHLTQDWEMLRPTSLSPDQVDQVRINGAATRLGYLIPSRVITNVTNLSQYGLAPPELAVTLTISDGQEVTLYAGNETPVDNNRYVRTAADEQTVYLVFSFAIDDLRRLLDEPPVVSTSTSP